MRPNWLKLASLVQKTWTHQEFLVVCVFSLLSVVILFRHFMQIVPQAFRNRIKDRMLPFLDMINYFFPF